MPTSIVSLPSPSFPPADHQELAEALAKSVAGEVRFDAQAKALYATDASAYRFAPIGVVIPSSVDDIVTAVAVCRERGVPVLPRGGGTSLAGQCTNRAVIIDTSARLREVNWIDADRRLASVQPGCVLDDLRDAAADHGLTFGPDPSTHNRCTVGGMIGNNACGMHAQMAGRTADNVRELEVLLYDGTRLRVGPTPDHRFDELAGRSDRIGEIYRRLREIRDDYGDAIRKGFPDIPRRVSGYTLEKLLPEHDGNVAAALVGSEGTCAIVLEAVVELVPNPEHRALVVFGFDDVYRAADAVTAVLEHDPIALEGIDDVLIEHMERKGLETEELPLLPDGRGWLMVELGDEDADRLDDRAEAMSTDLRDRFGSSCKLFEDPREEARLWDIREAGLGATARVPGRHDTHPGWEDSAVPPEALADYLRDLRDLFHRHGYSASVYGHFGQGCVHCRIDFEFGTRAGLSRYRAFVEEAADLVVSYGGSLSGEHGDGQSRGELLDRMYGREILDAFHRFKETWDPDWRMNPGKVIEARPLDVDVRRGPDHAPWHDRTYFAFPDDRGSLARASERCVGVGKCRRDDDHGTMCPSYMVTHDERHSTRGRAHLLFEMMRGEVITDGWRSKEVEEALDLCLACKGCKSECPVDVDMATYKAEFLAHHYARRIRPVQAYSLGLIHWWARIASRMPRLVNRLMRFEPLADLIRRFGGVTTKRAVPTFATTTFRDWFDRHTPAATGPEVIMWPDTFTNHLDPEPAVATVRVLEAAGFRVRIPGKVLCCGRPLYDYGLLGTARRLLRQVLDELRTDIRAGTPVVGVEPSCLAVFRDELPAMFPDDRDAARLASQAYTLAEFLEEHAPDFELPEIAGRAVRQTHCHHQAVMRAFADDRIAESMGVEVEDLDAGCCGLAGSFGFEQGTKYDVSVAAGERKMAPAIRAADDDTVVLADGFSCRTQIGHLTDRTAIHLAQLIADHL